MSSKGSRARAPHGCANAAGSRTTRGVRSSPWTTEMSAASTSPVISRPHIVRCGPPRSEEHTSELQSRPHLVCRLLLEKKNNDTPRHALHYQNPAQKLQ